MFFRIYLYTLMDDVNKKLEILVSQVLDKELTNKLNLGEDYALTPTKVSRDEAMRIYSIRLRNFDDKKMYNTVKDLSNLIRNLNESNYEYVYIWAFNLSSNAYYLIFTDIEVDDIIGYLYLADFS
jgi:hypothetical protein